MVRSYLPLAAAVILMVSASQASAFPKVTLLPAKDGRIDNLVPVMAQAASCVALSETHSLLAFGHDRTYADAQVSLVKLDAKGTPLAYVTPLKLPKAAGLKKFPNYVTGVAFHPKLPLLYVWQDVAVHYANPPAYDPADVKNFDHLHVINVADHEKPQLVVSLCRGPEYIYGQQCGGVAIDDSGGFLYVPNQCELKNPGSLRFGRFALDADGLPKLPEADKDAKSPAAVRSKRLTELNQAAPLTPTQMTPIEYVYLFNLTGTGTGTCFLPLGKDAVIGGVQSGLVTWRPDDKTVTLSAVSLQHAGNTRFTSHPTLPVLFATSWWHTNPSSFYRVEHSDGNPTLLPRQYVIPDSKLTGPPAVLAKSNKLAVGGHYLLYLMDLDDKGVPTGKAIRTPVLTPEVRALVYSPRFDRLYLGVEVSK